MRKGRDGGEKKTGKIREKTDDYSGHYVIASSRPQERQPLERRPLVPKIGGGGRKAEFALQYKMHFKSLDIFKAKENVGSSKHLSLFSYTYYMVSSTSMAESLSAPL